MPTYRAYGLSIQSDIALPVLQETHAPPDVTIAAGAVSEDTIGGMRYRNWEAKPDQFRIHFPEAGRIAVNAGHQILYDRMPGADDSHIVSVLLGTALAVIMMQRRRLPFHSCSVETPDGALLVVGKSGAGKSTMLTGLLEHGLPMIADDVTGAEISADGIPVAFPGFPAMRLWRDSLALAGKSEAGLVRVRSDLDKFYLPVPNFTAEPVPITAIAYLSVYNGEEVLVNELPPEIWIETLSRFIFRKNFLVGLGLQRFAFETAAATARHVRMLQIVRPAKSVLPSDMAAQLIAAAKA